MTVRAVRTEWDGLTLTYALTACPLRDDCSQRRREVVDPGDRPLPERAMARQMLPGWRDPRPGSGEVHAREGE